jgi:primosomal protein N'
MVMGSIAHIWVAKYANWLPQECLLINMKPQGVVSSRMLQLSFFVSQFQHEFKNIEQVVLSVQRNGFIASCNVCNI